MSHALLDTIRSSLMAAMQGNCINDTLPDSGTSTISIASKSVSVGNVVVLIDVVWTWKTYEVETDVGACARPQYISVAGSGRHALVVHVYRSSH